MSVSGMFGSPGGGGSYCWNSKTVDVYLLGSGGDFETKEEVSKKQTKHNDGTLNIELDFRRFTEYMSKVNISKKSDKNMKLYGALTSKGKGLNTWLTQLAIIDFLKKTKGNDKILYYTGHGIRNKGDWCFHDGVITFDWIYDKWKQNCAKRRQIVIISDCCYSGIWTQKAHALSSQHDGQFQVQSACGPRNKATDNVLSFHLFKLCFKGDPVKTGAAMNVSTGGYRDNKTEKWVSTYEIIKGSVQFI
eukprot:187139_1